MTLQALRQGVEWEKTAMASTARRHRREFLHYLSTARGSASEVSYLLLVAKDLGSTDHDQCSRPADDFTRVSRMLMRMLRALDRDSRPGRARFRVTRHKSLKSECR